MTRPVVALRDQGEGPAAASRILSRAVRLGHRGSRTRWGSCSIPARHRRAKEGVGGHIRGAESPGVSIFVQVLDPDETLRKAEEMGGRAVMQPFDVPGGPTIAQMADPEGNLVGLVKQ